MSETGIETQPVDTWAGVSIGAAILTLLSFCGGVAPIPLTGFICFPAAVGLGLVALVAGLRALRRIRRSGEGGRTFALIGTSIGGLTLLATLCMVVLGIWMYPSLIDLLSRLKL